MKRGTQTGSILIYILISIFLMGMAIAAAIQKGSLAPHKSRRC